MNTASRIEGLTKDKGHAIVVSQAFVDALGAAGAGDASEDGAGLVDLGEARVKGRDEPLHLWGA